MSTSESSLPRRLTIVVCCLLTAALYLLQAETGLGLYLLQSEGYIFGLLFLLETVALVSLVVTLAVRLRKGGVMPRRLVGEVNDLAARHAAAEVAARVRAERSFLGRAIHAGVGRLRFGVEEARRAAARMIEGFEAGQYRLIRYLTLIGILSPLLGLAGTLLGVILLLRAAGEGGDVSGLTDGVARCLSVTLHGLVLSVTAVFFQVVFKNRLSRVTTTAGLLVDNLLTQLGHPAG